MHIINLVTINVSESLGVPDLTTHLLLFLLYLRNLAQITLTLVTALTTCSMFRQLRNSSPAAG